MDHLNFFCPLHANTGSVSSAITLCTALKQNLQLTIWSLPVETRIDPEVINSFRELGLSVELAWPIPRLESGSSLFFYMGEYPILFNNHAEQWRQTFSDAKSVQFSINFNIGNLYKYPWLSDHLTKIYFQNNEIRDYWKYLLSSNELTHTNTVVLPPPVDISKFLRFPDPPNDTLVIGRLSGDQRLPAGSVDFYKHLSTELSGVEFWFMPTPGEILDEFSNHPRFRFYQYNEIEVEEFISRMNIYCVPVDPNSQRLQGTRSLVEVMAAARPSVHVNRMGPANRIEHGVSGYLTSDLKQMARYVIELARDPSLRKRMGTAAREKACKWRVSDWICEIVDGM